MDDDFNPDEFRPAAYRPDTEVTLGPMMLLGIFLGLMLLCGLCFGVGYSMGSRSAHESPATGQQPGAGAAAQAGGSHPKSSATSQKTHDAHSVRNDLPPSGVNGAKPGASTQNPNPASSSGGNSTQPRVSPALPDTANAVMIQIATLSRQEDANILISALSKRGYTATARRNAADNKLHVRIGPFRNRNEANAMRRKLINDGYNAIVEP
jgi:cell division septation protein DedD